MKKIILILIVCLTILSCSSTGNDGQICSKVTKIEKRYDGYTNGQSYIYYRVHFENGGEHVVEANEIYKYHVGKVACYYPPIGLML